jgi:hypothetical protein
VAEAEGGLEGGPLGRASEGPTGSGGEGAQAVTFADKVGDTDSEREEGRFRWEGRWHLCGMCLTVTAHCFLKSECQVLSQSGRLLSGGRGRKGLLFVTSRGSASVVSDSPSVEGGGPSSAFEPPDRPPSPRNRYGAANHHMSGKGCVS